MPDGVLTPALARRPVFAAMGLVAVVLTATSGRYGYHRDELYFRMLRSGWGYVDEPPLTPILARALSAIVDEPWALRIPATIATVASILVVALITREVGGGRGAQALCAWAYGFASVPLIMGHALLTSTVDLPVWPLVVLLVIRAERRREPGWWLLAGLVVGLSTYNKLLVVVLILALAGGVLLVGPRRLLWSRHVLGAVGIAIVVGLPNLAYQAAHDWPQLSMGRALAEHNAGSVRVVMWPFLFLLLGPPLVPIWIAGLVRLWRQPGLRFLAAAFPVLLILVFVMGSQQYYPIGLVAVLFAVGCVPTWEWVTRGQNPRRWVTFGFVGLNAAVSLTLGLPLIPLSVVGDSPVPSVNQVAADTIGWPRYVAQIATAYDAVPVAERAQTVIVTSNYGEAGAVDRYGRRYDLPAVYSGQNQLYYQGRPPSTATVAIIVGGQVTRARARFAVCTGAGRLDNGVGVDNEEQDEPIVVCRSPIGGWTSVWPHLKHED